MKLLFIISLFFSVSAFGQEVTVTMKEYIDKQIELMQRMNDLRDAHREEISRIKDENIKTAYAAQDKRLDGMNEFRETLKDSNSTYVTWKSLLAVLVGVTGFIFGYANYMRNKLAPNTSKNIQSGDTVEVKK